MLAGAVLTVLRQVASDTNSAGRWSDQTLLSFIDRANKRLVRDIKFPDSRISWSTVVNVGEYAIPPIILPLRLYVAGQLCVPLGTNGVDTLEGHQTGYYDQSQVNGTVPLTGSGAASNTLGPYSPAWAEQTPLSYPVGNTWGTPAPDSQPWFAGQRPRWYTRGGFIGLVPAPANVVTVSLDCIRVPDTITVASQSLLVPDDCLEALVWGAKKWMKSGDDADQGMASCEQAYMAEVRAMRGRFKVYTEGDAPGGPRPLTYRSRYTGYRKHRTRY